VSEVLSRPKLARYQLATDDVIDLLQTLARTLPTVDVDVDIPDPEDAPVVAAAVAGRADAIVTGDADLIDDADLREWLTERGVRLLSPRELPREAPNDCLRESTSPPIQLEVAQRLLGEGTFLHPSA
jgi:predicted nucleic acid-binding protein